jgi:methylated-DNA-[protein]-cysteine S-methyltransferase
MSEPVGEVVPALSGPAPEPVRVLLPSSLIGPLGIELVGSVVTRLLISPSARERRHLTPLHDLDESEIFDEIFGRLLEYLAGARRNLELEYDLGPSGVDAFARRVFKEATRVPYGKTRTYKDIAAAAGRPEAYRLALSILLANPIPLVIPCHRIVPNKGGLGSFVGGPTKKRLLLKLERESAAQA